MSKNKYSVILPTYNEKNNLPLIVYMLDKTFSKQLIDWEVIIVDDNSPDGTQEVAKKLINIFDKKRIQLVTRSSKQGLGSAYRYGLEFAKGNFIIIMDADLSHFPEDILKFIKKQKEQNYDVVTGTRYQKEGGIYGWGIMRKLTSKVANLLASTMLLVNFSDLTGSFRLYKKSAFKEIIESTKSKGYVFQMEILVRAKKKNYSIAEVPISFVDRLYGDSKLGNNEIIGYLIGVWNLFISI